MAGKNADFHRQDLWDAIASGNGPEWELGVQIVEESDVLAFGFDLLDPTKIFFIVATGAETLFTNGSSSTFFPANRPLQILLDGYRWGKPVGALGSAVSVIKIAGITTTPGVFTTNRTAAGDISTFVTSFEGGLKTFKFIDRFPVDS